VHSVRPAAYGCAVTEPLTWEQLELPVLRWVVASGQDQLDLQRGESSSVLAPALTDDQVDDALLRLKRHGMISGEPGEGSGTSWWTGLRPRPDGLRVLGEWPPVEAATLNVALARALRQLAGELPDQTEATAVRRAGGALSKMSGEVVLDVVKVEAKRLGAEAGE
jgi:hypothetical protein